MNEYESNMKEHKVTIVIGVVLIALLAIFVAKKRSRLEPESYAVRPVSEDKGDYIEDILSGTYLAEEEYAAGAGEDEISVSIGIGRGDGVVEPAVVSVAPDDEEVIEPVSREQESGKHTTYVVKKGDTLSAIAQRFYGDASRWRLIAEANDLSDPNTVRIGMELIIPQQQKVKPSRPARPAAEPRIDVAASGEDGTKKARDYIVKKNDSLWKIAAAEYGDGNKWPTVFAANRNSIRDKNSLRPGQVIRLPEP